MDQVYLLILKQKTKFKSKAQKKWWQWWEPETIWVDYDLPSQVIEVFEDLKEAEAEATRMNKEFSPSATYWVMAMRYTKSRINTENT